MKLSSFSVVLLGLISQTQYFTTRACTTGHSHDDDGHHTANHRRLGGTGGKGKPDVIDFPDCGTPKPSKEEEIEAGKHVDEWRSNRRNNKDKRLLAEVNYQIPVTFHVLRSGTGGGDVSDTQLDQYMFHLNDEYGESSFTFYKKGTNRVKNDYWHLCNSDTFYDAGKNLRVGGIGDMNVYFCDIQNGAGGWAYFPQARGQYFDGIVIESNYVKYGFPASYVRRPVLPHEAG
jgi:hypothetical protein